jgi:Helitron helicase-like domain at N-terminus
VLLFPHGNPGWGLSALTEYPDLSQINSYRSRLYANDDARFTTLGRLTCEYLVDMYSRCEEQRLLYITQERQRQYDARDHFNNSDEPDEEHYRLPASSMGSQAWASEQTADSMALGKTYGEPSFLCTMTFNPNWPELQDQIKYGQSASDLPFIIDRIFKHHLEKVLQTLRTQFGEKKYLIKVIEFQERGFPHAHNIIKVFTVFHN